MRRDHDGPHVLFRVAVGPRTGFGHLVRALSLAEAMGVEPALSIRGGAAGLMTARTLGAHVVEERGPSAAIDHVRPDLLVIDDREAAATAGWRRTARRRQVPILSIHDLGLGLGDADVIVDGSIVPPNRRLPSQAFLGPDYAILNPRTIGSRQRQSAQRTVVVALGGGRRAGLAAGVAEAIVAREPDVTVLVAGGFVDSGSRSSDHRVRGLRASEFGVALASADVAVTAGGLTLYEGCCLGAPLVALAVVASQRPTVLAFARQRALVNAGLVEPGRRAQANAARRVADLVSGLLGSPVRRREMSVVARRLVDGRGAMRVARIARRLAARRAGDRS
jgi:spore coat polysaccharide biosynthesis predicted glycosyltransferase SpsG